MPRPRLIEPGYILAVLRESGEAMNGTAVAAALRTSGWVPDGVDELRLRNCVRAWLANNLHLVERVARGYYRARVKMSQAERERAQVEGAPAPMPASSRPITKSGWSPAQKHEGPSIITLSPADLERGQRDLVVGMPDDLSSAAAWHLAAARHHLAAYAALKRLEREA